MADTTITGLNTAVGGLQTQDARVNTDVNALNEALVAAQNQLAAVTGSGSAAPSDGLSDGALAASQSTDIVAPLVDLLQASLAYKTNAAAVRVTADVEQATVDMMGHRVTES